MKIQPQTPKGRTMSRPTYHYKPVEIGYFLEKHAQFNDYPSCQREYVWQPFMQTKLIDSILRGLPTSIIILMPAPEDAFGGKRFWVVDGQQRLETIRRFVAGEFATAKNFNEEPGLKPLVPGKKYHELSPADKQRFDSYELQICLITGVDVEEFEDVFRRINRQVALAFAERLYSYSSPVRAFAERFNDSPFWQAWRGKLNRKQDYQMIVTALVIERLGGAANITSTRLTDLVTSASPELTPELSATVARRLALAARLYEGAAMKKIYHFPVVYQSVIMLERAGARLHAAPTGALAKWFNELLVTGAADWRARFGKDLFSNFEEVGKQHIFWRLHLDALLATEGIVIPDKKRAFGEVDRLQAWLRQGGKCHVCGENVSVEDHAHHDMPHALGGATTADNCRLAHAACHARLHLAA